MSDKRENENDATPAHHEQPWREQRHQPEPKAIEGRHAGPTRARGLAAPDHATIPAWASASQVEGDDARRRPGPEGGSARATGSATMAAGGDHQGTDRSPPDGGPGTTHARGAGPRHRGRLWRGDGPQLTPARCNDFRDAGISKREVGPNEHGDRTQGGDHVARAAAAYFGISGAI